MSAVFDEADERAAILAAYGLTPPEVSHVESSGGAPTQAEVTLWTSLTDTNGTPKALDWLTWFARLSEAGPFLGDNHPGWSAATFEPCKRAKKNVQRLSAVVLDYDGKDGHGRADRGGVGNLGRVLWVRAHDEEPHSRDAELPCRTAALEAGNARGVASDLDGTLRA